MSLKKGELIRTPGLGLELYVVKKIGEGTQGEVFLVESGDTQYALKWYRPEQATTGQKKAIEDLVRSGAPAGEAGKRFVWPLDTAESEWRKGELGYIMPVIDKSRFAELGEVWAHIKPLPDLAAMCEISYQLANSFRGLHLSGYCFRDISAGNLRFDPKSGDIVICDNDNVAVNKDPDFQVWGTMEYMAPELITGKTVPSAETDLHSLAVLLFHLWIWHHPMHGRLEYNYHCWDIASKKKVYGEDPVFIFDPVDTRNTLPADPDYYIAEKRWSICPNSLKMLFIKAFTTGLKDPGKRITEGEWQRLFIQLRDCIVPCPSCHVLNIWEPGRTTDCWHCQRRVIPGTLVVFRHAKTEQYLIPREGCIITGRHINNGIHGPNGDYTVGKIVRNPDNPGIFGIRNLSGKTWIARIGEGQSIEVPDGKAVPINSRIRIEIEDTELQIRRNE